MLFEINRKFYIKDLKIINPKKLEDKRGFFRRCIEINPLVDIICNMSDIDIYTIHY